MSYWGPHFPDAVGSRFYWAQHFPEYAVDPGLVAAVGPATAAAFALSVADGMTVRWSWQNDVVKSYSGLETRGANFSLPSAVYSGQAYLAGTDATSQRALLMRYAAAGSAFLLGLPHEELTLSADAAGAVLTVASTTLSDWTVPGQRVVVATADYSQSVVGVVQSVTGTTIVLDVSPGSTVGRRGGRVMPAVPVYLEDKQGFSRHPAPASGTGQGLELWQFTARAIMFGYETGASVAAFVRLAGYTGGYLTACTVGFSNPGTVGNGSSLQLVSDAGAPSSGAVVTGPNVVSFHFKPLVTTLQNLLTALASTNLRLYGPLPGLTTTLRTGVDEFGPAVLAGGTDKSWGTMGAGAAVTSYESRPVWDRPIVMPGGSPVGDSMQSLADVVDLGGVPLDVGVAAQPDWGRQVIWERTSQAEWQWLKAMLSTVRGRQRAFWLPTWRADLSPVQLTPGSLKVSSAVGDYFGWAPYRSSLQLQDAAGVIRYFTVTSAVDNGDGTITLTVTCSDVAYSTGGGGSTLTSFQLLSWLDLCRFEQDELEVTFSADGFTFVADARAVAR